MSRTVLWTCPKCRHRFVTKNLWHSCVRVPLRAHFRGKTAALSPTFKAWAVDDELRTLVKQAYRHAKQVR